MEEDILNYLYHTLPVTPFKVSTGLPTKDEPFKTRRGRICFLKCILKLRFLPSFNLLMAYLVIWQKKFTAAGNNEIVETDNKNSVQLSLKSYPLM